MSVHTLQGVWHTYYEQTNLPTVMGEGIGCISKSFTSSEYVRYP